MTNGLTYYFVVSAKDAAAESPNSNERSAVPVAPPPTVTLTANPAAITAGESTALTWNSTNTDECIASGGWTGLKAVSGTANVTPSSTTTYTLTCGGMGGSASASTEITVNPLMVQESPTLYVKNVDYNAAGQMTRIEYGNGTATDYTYDELTLRLTRIWTLDANSSTLQDLSYTYDSVGNILSITDKVNTATRTFKYDELSRLVEASNPNPGSYGTKSYVYDALGNIVEKDGKTYFYGGTSGGPHAVTSLSDGTEFGYDANGNMTAKTEGAVTTGYSYDAENRLIEVSKDNVRIASYAYDGDGGRTAKTVYDGGSQNNTCFLAGTRVVMADGTTKAIEEARIGDEVLSYDKTGMRTVPAKVIGVFTHEEKEGYMVVNERLKATANHLFYSEGLWREAGELSVGGKLLSPGLADIPVEKLEKVKTSEPVAVYNIEVDGSHNYFVTIGDEGAGVLVHNKLSFTGGTGASTTEGKTTTYVGQLFEKDDARTTKYVFLGGTRVASVTNPSTSSGQAAVLYYHADHLGGANVLTDSAGVKKELIEYEPFGLESRHEKYGSSEEVAWYYFTGKPKDDETGLYYFGARYYDPSLGRFITPDTIVQSSGNPQTFNRYTYSGNNPVNFVDPTGHWFWMAVVAIFKAVSAYAVAHPIIAGAIAGGVLGGANAAINGTNIAQGIGLGVLGGAIGGGIGLGVGSYLEKGLGTFWSGMVGAGLGGASASATTTAIIGGDVGLGALAGLAGAVVAFGGSRVWPLGADAVAGGVSSVVQGGEFGEGAKMGAIDNAMTTMLELALPAETMDEQKPQAGDLGYMKPDNPLSSLVSFLEGGAFSHVKLLDDQNRWISATPPKGVDAFSYDSYKNRRGVVINKFRGNQSVINAAKAQVVAKPPLTYNFVFGGRGRVCSTCVGNAISVGAGIPWTGIGPNSQYQIFKSYGE